MIALTKENFDDIFKVNPEFDQELYRKPTLEEISKTMNINFCGTDISFPCAFFMSADPEKNPWHYIASKWIDDCGYQISDEPLFFDRFSVEIVQKVADFVWEFFEKRPIEVPQIIQMKTAFNEGYPVGVDILNEFDEIEAFKPFEKWTTYNTNSTFEEKKKFFELFELANYFGIEYLERVLFRWMVVFKFSNENTFYADLNTFGCTRFFETFLGHERVKNYLGQFIEMMRSIYSDFESEDYHNISEFIDFGELNEIFDVSECEKNPDRIDELLYKFEQKIIAQNTPELAEIMKFKEKI